MKNSLLILLFLFAALSAIQAQMVPQGMRYQAVARDASGQVIENQKVALRLTLKAGEKGDALYTELHQVTTNQLGLFSITIGEGKSTHGKFSEIPWSVANIWLDIDMDENGGKNYMTINSTQLLTVPYAFHSGTADKVLGGEPGNEKNGLQFYWSTTGNLGTLPPTHFIGTRDAKDLVIKTNNVERMIMKSSGEIEINGSFDVGSDIFIGNDALIKNDLVVDNNASIGNDLLVGQDLRVDRDISVGRNGLIENNFQIDNDLGVGNNATIDNDLRVNRDISAGRNGLIENNLTVGNDATIDNDLRVDRDLSVGRDGLFENNLRINNNTSVGNNLLVENDLTVENNALFNEFVLLDNAALGSSSTSTGALVVAGGVGIGQNLNVGGILQTSTMNVTSDNANFVATFNNTNTGNGDGIAIKLGRNHPQWNGSSFNNVTLPWTAQLASQIGVVEGWIKGNAFSPTDLLNLWPASIQAGFLLSVVNAVTAELNDELNLPISIGPYGFPAFTLVPQTTLFPGLDLDILGEIPPIVIGPYTIPATNIVPQIQVFPEIPQIPLGALGLPTLSMPTISFTNVSNSLTKNNEFIKFMDKDDRELGSIRAQSIENWELDFLDPVFIINVLGGLVGIDFVSGAINLIVGFTNVCDAYNKLGVEYSSGHGDYAEWLPREVENEHISAGDIVGIKAGRISKNLEGAEQILAISSKPIMLGNVPEAGKEHLGNKVAFLGQIPVKINGAVNSGDYIIAKGDVPGYGVAVSPENITLNDIPKIIGRSWETHESSGPKMINTIIGLNNNDLIHILAREMKKIENLESRVTQLEEVWENLSGRAAFQNNAAVKQLETIK